MAAADVLRSTAFRLTLVATVVVGLVAAGAVTLVGRHVNQRLMRATDAAIERDAGELRRTFGAEGFAALAAAVEARSHHVGGGLYYLSDPAGLRRAGNLAAPPLALSGGDRGTFTWPAGPGGRGRTAAGLVARLDGAGILVVARDVEEQREFLEVLRRDIALALGGIALAGIAGGLLLARAILARIDAMARASRTIMAGDLSRRLPRAGTDDELDRLADQLNAMLERIERLMAGLREVSDNIAHDLKTPLNRLRNRAEAALADRRQGPAWRDGLEATIEAADELIKTFNALLLIARLEAGAVEETLEPVDLAELVRGVAELYAPAAEDAGVELRVEAGGGPVTVAANRQLIGQALANLIENAMKYGARGASNGRDGAGAAAAPGSAASTATPVPPGAPPVVVIAVGAEGERARLAVADRGPGIAPADRARALRRFGRLDQSRSAPGTGLGLSLVAAVAQMHRGSIALEDNAPGLRVVLTLPLAPAAGKAGAGQGRQAEIARKVEA